MARTQSLIKSLKTPLKARGKTFADVAVDPGIKRLNRSHVAGLAGGLFVIWTQSGLGPGNWHNTLPMQGAVIT